MQGVYKLSPDFVSIAKNCYIIKEGLGFLVLIKCRVICMKAKFLYLVIGFLVLVGCASGTKYLEYKHSFLLGQGKPPAYVDGYIDGCSTGRRMAGENQFSYRKDAERMEKDALYARGWQDGQITCRNEALIEQQQAHQAQNYGSRSASIDEERNRRMAVECKAAEAEMREIWEELKK